MLESHEMGIFNFPEQKEDLADNFFLNRKKSFKKLKKIDPFKEHVYGVSQEEYEELMSLNLDNIIISDNPEYNKYQEGYFDFTEGFTDKFLISNSFISLNQDLNLKDSFSDLFKYNDSYNKIIYLFTDKLKRLNLKFEYARSRLKTEMIEMMMFRPYVNSDFNPIIDYSFKGVFNNRRILLIEYLKILKKTKNLEEKFMIFKNSTYKIHSIENNILNFNITKIIQDYKFISNSFIYNLEKKNFSINILKEKLYFFNIYNEFLSKNFNYFFMKKINSKFSYVYVNTFNKDFLAYLKHITYYFKEHRFLFFYDFKNKEFIKNYKIYEGVLKSNYGQNKDFDSYLFMSSNYNVLNSNFNLFFINNLKNVFKQQICWNNLQNKNLKLNNQEINIMMDNFKSLFYYFKLNKYNLETILLSKYFLINNKPLYSINSAFLIFNKLEQHIKENIQNKFLLQNYYNSPKFFITTFDRLNFFLKYNYYTGRSFQKLDINLKKHTNMIFTYTENILDKSLLLRTQNRFLSLEYYSIIDKIAKIENALEIINLEKNQMPASFDIPPNDINTHFVDLNPFILKYPFPFVGENLLLEREFLLENNNIIIKKKRFKYFKKFLINIYYVCSEEFSLKYFNIEFWQYQLNNLLFFFNIDIDFNEETKNNEKNLNNFIQNSDTDILNLKMFIKFISSFFKIKQALFPYINAYFFENHKENFILLEKEEQENFIIKYFDLWLNYVLFFLLQISFLKYLGSEYDLLENQRLICLDLNFEKKIGINSANLNITSEVFSINSKLMNNLFKDLNYFYYNKISNSYNVFKFVDSLKYDFYDEEELGAKNKQENDNEDNEDDDDEEIINLTNEQKVINDLEEELKELTEETEDYVIQLNSLFLTQELFIDIDILPREERMNINDEKYLWLYKCVVFIYGDEYRKSDVTFFSSQIKSFMTRMAKK